MKTSLDGLSNRFEVVGENWWTQRSVNIDYTVWGM